MASDIGYDLVVYDNDNKAIANEYSKFGERLEKYIDSYSEILKRVANDGVKSGKVHDNLLKFIEAVDSLKNEGKELSELAKKSAEDFLKDMDTADNYLY